MYLLALFFCFCFLAGLFSAATRQILRLMFIIKLNLLKFLSRTKFVYKVLFYSNCYKSWMVFDMIEPSKISVLQVLNSVFSVTSLKHLFRLSSCCIFNLLAFFYFYLISTSVSNCLYYKVLKGKHNDLFSIFIVYFSHCASCAKLDRVQIAIYDIFKFKLVYIDIPVLFFSGYGCDAKKKKSDSN